MIPESFEYFAPQTLADAFALLQQHGEDAKILAGGHSLIPMMKLRFAAPTHLIDINNIPNLSYIKEESGYLKIGAMTKEVMLEESDVIKSKYPIFTDASKLIADPQVRNFGTIGGNIAHGDAANDHPAVMLALRAETVIAGTGGERVVPIDEFFFGFYTTAVQQGEILTEIRIPELTGKSGSAYHKLERKVGDYATVGVAAVISLHEDGSCKSAGIGLTNVNPTPLRASRTEEALVGTALTNDDIEKAALFASEDCSPNDDLRGSEAFKRDMVRVITKRIIKKAIERCSG